MPGAARWPASAAVSITAPWPTERPDRRRRPVARDQNIAQADRNRARMREMDDERRRATMAELQATASDRKRLHAFALKSSMIEGLRKAAAIA